MSVISRKSKILYFKELFMSKNFIFSFKSQEWGIYLLPFRNKRISSCNLSIDPFENH